MSLYDNRLPTNYSKVALSFLVIKLSTLAHLEFMAGISDLCAGIP